MARITVEDCLEKEHNRFALVLLAAKRAKQILEGADLTIPNSQSNKSVVMALREVADGSVAFKTEEELEREREEQEAENAITTVFGDDSGDDSESSNGSEESVAS